MKKVIILIAISIVILLFSLLIPLRENLVIKSSLLIKSDPLTEIAFTIKTSDFTYYLENNQFKIVKGDKTLTLNPIYYDKKSNLELFIENWIALDRNRYLSPDNCTYLFIRINNPIEKISNLQCLDKI